MDPGAARPNGPAERQIAELVNEYFDRRQSGEDLTPDRFAAEHPALADELRPYLEGLALIDQARSAAGGEAVLAAGGDGAVAAGPLPLIEGYELREEIGRGGMGVVYKARQVATKRTVAVKVMLTGPFASPAARRRFAREVELAARLDHPGVVRILASGTVAGQPYYAMEFVDGVRLDRYLAETAPDVPRTLRLFVAICETVEAAHRHGVIHRDLKPANVLVDREGRLHILDFGLAKAIDQADEAQTSYRTLSTPGQVMGTLAYLSPEQAAGVPGQVDGRTDVYALGVMLFEALTGQLPLDARGRPLEVIQRILEAPPLPPTRLSPRVDGDLETIVLKALAKEPAQRYGSAGALGADLGRYLSNEPVLARRPSSLYYVRKKLAKHRARIALVAALAAVVLGGAWGRAWWQQRRAQQRAAHELAEARLEALRVLQMLDAGDIRPARLRAHAAFTTAPPLPEDALVLAQAAFADRDAEQAVNTLERAMEAGVDDWAAAALLSEMYARLGQVEPAERLAEQAGATMPDTADAWYLRSLATLDRRAAAGCAQRCVQRDPAHVLAWARLARLHVRLGDLDEALRAAERLVALQPADARWRLLKAEVFLRRGEPARALDAYPDAARAGPSREAPNPFQALAYRRLRQYAAAIAEYDRIINLEGARPGVVPIWHRYQRATPLWISGRTAEAAADYEFVRSVHGRPHYADARLAIVYHELGRPADSAAVLAAARAAADEPWLAKIFACLAGDLAPDALVAAPEAGEPGRLCEACYYAGEACLLHGQPESARGWFERAVQTGTVWEPRGFHLAPLNEYELAEWRLTLLAPPATRPAADLP